MASDGDGPLEDLLPVLDQGVTELLDSLRSNLMDWSIMSQRGSTGMRASEPGGQSVNCTSGGLTMYPRNSPEQSECHYLRVTLRNVLPGMCLPSRPIMLNDVQAAEQSLQHGSPSGSPD